MAAQELVEEGKVKYIGLSECPPADVRTAHAIHPVTALEMVRRFSLAQEQFSSLACNRST